jgi:hypothetical protein
MSISKHGVHNENVENTNGVTRIRESKNDKQYNEQKKATKTMNHFHLEKNTLHIFVNCVCSQAGPGLSLTYVVVFVVFNNFR